MALYAWDPLSASFLPVSIDPASGGLVVAGISISGDINVDAKAKANAAAPALVEASFNPLSTDLAGNLRTVGALAAPQGSYTSKSGSIGAGGTSQQLAAANALRKKIIIQNPATAAGQNIATAESLYIRFGAAAGVDAGTSFELLPGGVFSSEVDFVSTEAINVVAATINHRWIALEA